MAIVVTDLGVNHIMLDLAMLLYLIWGNPIINSDS